MAILQDFQSAQKAHIDLALEQIMDARCQRPTPEHVTQMSLSLCCEQIAHALSDAAHIQAGADPRPLSELIPTQAEGFRRNAERAIGMSDPETRRRVTEQVIGEIRYWSEALEDEQLKLRLDDVVRETLARFLMANWGTR